MLTNKYYALYTVAFKQSIINW